MAQSVSCALRRPQYPMRLHVTPLVLTALLAVAGPSQAGGDRKTVCTITVNSPDEKEAFRRAPAAGQVPIRRAGRARPPRLARVARAAQGVRCDVLVISGHYDGGHEFFSDRTEAQEFLPVDEMERVACSDSCPGLFSAAEGGLSLRLQHAQSRRRRRAHPPRSGAACSAPATRAPMPNGWRGRSRARHGESAPRPDAADLQGRARDLRLLVGRAARDRRPASILEPLFPGGRRARGRQRPRERPAARRVHRPLADA